MKRLVVFTGAGVSADSGIATFRDSDGLWANYRIEEVCTPEALIRNRKKVIEFYNERRKEILSKSPNAGHLAIKNMENYFDVQVITQNIDNLHERAGSKHILHLHGEITKLRSNNDDLATVPIEGWEQSLDARHPDGSLLRPYIVFFGEAVPYFDKAIEIAKTAEIFVVVGTSLAVYPAASLIYNIKPDVPVYVVDPGEPAISGIRNKVVHIKENSVIGLPKLVKLLTEKTN
ncbi:MAG: NAD-dependent deacylase [Sphingobacteriia bacterium]|nr:NAD-dependent deacylase [Paludibacteraceae bacterium]NCA78612.1 NAD-dependent deacylase [Sphingobacteriia bacterium]